MTGENRSSTGIEIVDSLQGLQKTIDYIADPDMKMARVRKAVGLLAARELLGHQFMVNSAQVLAKKPDGSPRDRIIFNGGMIFIARLESYNYLLDQDIPLDCLAMNFITPEVIGASIDDEEVMRTLTFQVPVLAIDSCCSAEIAA